MQHASIVKLTMTDNSDQHEITMMKTLQEQLEEQIGGALCLKHYALPVCRDRHTASGWVIDIYCCCKQQTALTQDRLGKIYR